MEKKMNKNNIKKIILILALLLIGAGVGYFFGYDIGYEKAVTQSNTIKANCEKEAETKSREQLKSKYGDVLSKDFVVGSPYYGNYYQECLSKN